MKVTLTVHGKERDGQKFEFTESGSLLFGRSEKAQCRIADDPYVSRAHFLLFINPPDVRLRNLSKANGTEVDGVLYTQEGRATAGSEAQTLVKGDDTEEPAEAVLHDGSQIEVGYTRMSVAIEAERQVYCGECGLLVPARDKEAADQGQYYLCSNCREACRREWEPRRGAVRQARVTRPALVARGPGQAGPPVGAPDRLVEMILRRLGIRELKGPIPTIPGYEIIGQLNVGGMGLILEGTKLSGGHRVAVKIIKPDRPITKENRSRFRREMRIVRELRHPHIIEFIDGGDANGLLWFAMEFVDGGYDAARHITMCDGHIPIPEALDLVLQALDGLAFAYRTKTIVHRDIKPSNILLPRRGAGYTAKLTDFGLAKSLEDSGLNGSLFTPKGLRMGTVPYMPPEQAVDVRTATRTADVFSMGATLYHMLTGRSIRDFSRIPNEALRQVVHDPVVPIRDRDSSIPAPLASVIDRSLSLEPAARYADASEFKEALQGAMG